MECFIKKIFLGKADEACHRQFVRFSKGKFAGRAVLSLNKEASVKIGGSFEWANEFAILVSELADVKFLGIVLSKDAIEGLSGKKKTSRYEYNFSGNSDELRKISEKAYAMLLDTELLDGEGSGISLKIKKKLPKPGKSRDAKLDDKFCQLEADLKYWPMIKEAFFWDVPECKKAKIQHEYVIDEIILPKGEKDFETSKLQESNILDSYQNSKRILKLKNFDSTQKQDIFEKIRLMAKRKGKLLRKLVVDGTESSKEIEMEV